MARTINEIKKEMTMDFVSNVDVRVKYGLDEHGGDQEKKKSFEEEFSPVSLESIFFYIVAVAIWALEALFGVHKKEVDKALSERRPHRLKWYRNKVLEFQQGDTLLEDSDVYPVINESKRVVKYAAAVETPDSSKLYIKIAGGTSKRDKLDDATAVEVYEYLQQIKDAGVRIDLVNKSPDYFAVTLDIYYDAILDKEKVESEVQKTIEDFIENLPFNGEYSNMALVDRLQQIDGVLIPELLEACSKPHGTNDNFAKINAKTLPQAGYFRIYDRENDLKIKMIPYDVAQD